MVLDPDPGVRTAITVALDAFAATGSAFKAVRSLRDQHLGFPARHHGGPHHGELYWKPATHTQMLSLLHNPRYAGAYCYGRARHTTDLDGHHRTLTKSIKDWTVFIPDANPGYITWAQYETNQATLLANAAAHGSDRTAGPAREGPALLQGLAANAEHADTIRAAHVQRAQHHADAARRRYLAVDPASRLVADALEADWNTALRDLADAQDDYTKAKTDTANLLNDDQRQRIRALAVDFPALWNDPATPLRERKRLIRLLVTDVTMLRNDTSITVHLRLPGGQDHTMTVPLAPQHWHKNPTPATTLAILDQLLGTATFAQTAAALTQRGLADGAGRPFTPERVRYHCSFFHIPTRSQRLHARGLLTLDEIAKRFDVHPCTVKRWREL